MILALEDFVFDFNDLGFPRAIVSCEVIELSGNTLSVKVTEVKLHSDRIKIDEGFLLEICNDPNRAIYGDIAEQIFRLWDEDVRFTKKAN